MIRNKQKEAVIESPVSLKHANPTLNDCKF